MNLNDQLVQKCGEKLAKYDVKEEEMVESALYFISHRVGRPLTAPAWLHSPSGPEVDVRSINYRQISGLPNS